MSKQSLLNRSNRSLATLDYTRLVSPLLVILYAVGVAGHLYTGTLPLMLAMTPWFLLGCGLLVAWPSLRSGGPGFLLWLLAVYLFTFAMEALGVATGLVFGAYRYGPVLGLQVLEVPVVIAFNWVLVVYGALRLAERLFRSRVLIAVLTAALATAFDWVMEPLAIRLNYWRWAGGDIPLQNYLAWFIIAFAAALAYLFIVRRARRHPGQAAGTLAAIYVIIQACFFGLIRLGWLIGL